MSQIRSRLDEIGTLSHGETQEYRIFGPPGTGKTTNLSRQITRAAKKCGSDSVMVTSFSKTAAAELVGRNLPVPKSMVGTLHSHCYCALGGPEIAELHADEWTREHPALPIRQKRSRRASNEDEEFGDSPVGVSGGRKGDGDALLEGLNRWRGRMIPRSRWPEALRQFWAWWSDWKDSAGLMDFTDLIETALDDISIAPGNPSVLFVDEAQDLNKMQLSLIRRWGESADWFVICADDDQTIYSFMGAQPDAVLDPPIPDDHKIVLRQSHRVPRAVHRAATQWIERVSRREPKEYLPRDHEGAVRMLPSGGYKQPDHVIADALPYLDAGKSIMMLTTCEYMLHRLITALRDRGIAYGNRYARQRPDWNPLTPPSGTSTAQRILALLSAHPGAMGDRAARWSGCLVQQWVPYLRSKGLLKRGAKKTIESLLLDEQVTIQHLDAWFERGPLERMLDTFDLPYQHLLRWWIENVTPSRAEQVAFPGRVADRYLEWLTQPQITVGTIHSVKGGQADVVYLFPDLSRSGAEQYGMRGEDRDAVIRQFYVGMTRAREELVIVPPASPKSVGGWDLCG